MVDRLQQVHYRFYHSLHRRLQRQRSDHYHCITTKATTNKTTASTTTTTKKTTTATNGPKPSVKASLYGDVNLDGRVDITDAVLLNKKVAGVVILNDQQYANADCCTDDGVGQADSTVLLQFLVSIVRTLPAEG